MTPGKGSERINSRLIVVYGGPKCRKTTSASHLTGAKWIVSDANCIPTLTALGRLPPDEDLYEVDGIAAGRQVTQEAIKIAEEHGSKALPPAFVYDSITQFQDWHEQDVAQATNQRFMGDNKKEGGWQQFNAEFGSFIDEIGVLSRYVTCVVIAHAKEKSDGSKGEWAGLNLKPQMALKLARTANWVLYQSIRNFAAAESDQSDEFVNVWKDVNGNLRGTEVIINTQTVGFWTAAVNARHLEPEEPANLAAILKKEGLWK